VKIKGEDVARPSGSGMGDVKMEGIDDDDDEDDDDDDEDMEEIS
jgi:transcription initiation factor TFIIF subunit beta